MANWWFKFSTLRNTFVALVIIAAFGMFVWNSELVPSSLIPKHLRNYASGYIKKEVIGSYQRNYSSLGKLPTELAFENIYWQVLNTSGKGSFKMVNAYYDDRNFFAAKPLIRILGYYEQFDPLVKLKCQLWFEDRMYEPVIAGTGYTLIYGPYPGNSHEGILPYLANCPNPLASYGLVPTSVSLVENPKDNARNKLEVINNRPIDGKKKFVGVCTKDLEFPLEEDRSLKLIEWVEIMHLLGVDKIFIYVVRIHPNMMKALKYFEAQGKLKIEMVTQPAGYPGKHGSKIRQYHQEQISLTDCLYKHLHEYEYMLPIDTDEIIVPTMQEDKTLLDLLNRVKAVTGVKKACAYYAKMVFFLDQNNAGNETQPEVPSHLYFLQHVYRAKSFSGPGLKSFQSTEHVVVLHNHYPLSCTKGVTYQTISTDFGKLHHYRKGCGDCSAKQYADYTQNTVKDLTLWKIKDDLILNMKRTLDDLKTFQMNDD